MPYKSFSNDAEAFIQSPAYHSSDFRQMLHDLTKIKFSIQSDRDAAKGMIGNLTVFYDIAGTNERFPNDGLYLILDSSDWNKKWQDLHASLDYKSADKDLKNKKWPDSTLPLSGNGDNKREAIGPNESWNYDDASMAYRNTLRSMSDQLGRREGLVNRSIFESRFNLHWFLPENTGYFKSSLSTRVRIRQFVINNNNIYSDAWPGVGNVINLHELPDNLNIEGDYIYFWGPHTLAHRTRFTFTIASMSLTDHLIIATND